MTARLLTRSLLLAALLGTTVSAKIVRRQVDYRDGDLPMEGWVVQDDSIKDRRPALLLFHQWGGISDYELMRAEQFAQLGIVVFVADIYGKGVRPATTQERTAESTRYRSQRPLLRERAFAALEAASLQDTVDTNRVFAIGFCFGGIAALELARAGAPLAGVISVHGALDTPNPDDAARIRCPVLVLQGGADPFVPDDQVQAFRKEMRQAQVDWQIVEFGGAVHAFTDPSAGDDPRRGAAYHEQATRRALREIRLFLRDRLRPAEPEEHTPSTTP